MKARIATIGFLTISALLASFYFSGRATESSKPEAKAIEPGEALPRQSAAPVPATQQDQSASDSTRKTRKPQLDDYRITSNDTGSQYAQAAGWPGAQNDEDARWLSAHGFPSRDQFTDYSMKTPEQLKQAADAGDIMALIFLARWKMQNRQEEEAFEELRSATARGALYGLYVIAESYLRTADASSSLDTKRLLYRAACEHLLTAAILGDSRAIGKCSLVSARFASATGERFDHLPMLETALGHAFSIRQRRIRMGLGDFVSQPPRPAGGKLMQR